MLDDATADKRCEWIVRTKVGLDLKIIFQEPIEIQPATQIQV